MGRVTGLEPVTYGSFSNLICAESAFINFLYILYQKFYEKANYLIYLRFDKVWRHILAVSLAAPLGFEPRTAPSEGDLLLI